MDVFGIHRQVIDEYRAFTSGFVDVRDDAEYVLDSFTVLRRYDERDHGEFRTKHLVLTEYDAMSHAAANPIPSAEPVLTGEVQATPALEGRMAEGDVIPVAADRAPAGPYRSPLNPPPGDGPRHPARQI